MAYTKQTWVNGSGGGTPLSAARLNYIESGIEAASTAVSPMINVKDATYGAVGNGSTDDTAAINAATAAANTAGGGIVYFPPGTYITTGVTVYSYVTLQGAGQNLSILKLKNSSTGTVIKSLNYDTLVGTDLGGGTRNVGIRSLSVDGNKSGATSGGKGIALWGPGFVIEDVDVHHCHGDGLEFDYDDRGGGGSGAIVPLESNLSRVRSYNNDGNGYDVQGAHDSMVVDCVAAQNGDTGFQAGGDGWVFVNCHAWGNTNYGWHMSGTTHLTNCQGEGATIANFYIDWHQVSIIGGASFFPVGATAKGLAFGASTPRPKTFVMQGTRFYGYSSSSGSSIDVTNLGAQAYISCLVDQASGTAITGSLPADAYANIQVSGGTSTASVVQIPGFVGSNPTTTTAPAAPAIYDTFLGADGSAPKAHWTTTIGAGTGAALSIQSNAVRMTAGSTGSYSANDKVSLTSNLGSSITDGELFFCHVQGSTTSLESILYATLRSAAVTPLGGANAYYLEIDNFTNSTTRPIVAKRVASSNTTLYTGSTVTSTAGTKNWYRFRVQGSTVSMKTWADGVAEPTAWTFTTTDTSVTAAGYAGFSLGGGAAAAVNPIQNIDNAAVYLLGDYGPYLRGRNTVALADGGTGAALTDPGADRLTFWDDSANTIDWLTLGTNLSITGTTINAAGGSGTIDASTVGFRYLPPGQYKTANYYFCNSAGSNSTSATLGNNTARASAWVVTASITITRLFTDYTVVGNAGSTFRFVIWNDDGTNQPGTVLLDAGTVATDGTPGPVEVTVSQALTPGLYWVGGIVQNAATTQPTMRTCAGAALPSEFATAGTTLPVAGATVLGYAKTGMTGAAATFTSPGTTANVPRIGFKVT